MLRPYGRLLRVPGVALPLIASFVGRVPQGMVALATVLLIADITGSYGAAGVVTAAHSAGVALMAPVLGRLIDRWGQTRILVPSAIAGPGLLVVLVAVAPESSVPAMAALSFAAGAVFPPLSACMRALWSSLLDTANPLRDSAFAFDAVLVEMTFIVGPLLVVAAVASAGPAAGLLVAAGLLAAGSLVFAIAPASRRWAGSTHRAGWLGPMTSRGMRTLVGTFAAMSLAFGVLDVGIPAFADSVGSPSAAGPLFSSLATGSLLGGLLYGGRSWSWSLPRRYLVLLLGLAAGLVSLPLAGTTPVMLGLMLVAGVALAPVVITAYRMIDQLAPSGTVTEAYTWTTTANVVGAAVGAAVAGAVTDAYGPWAALGLASVGVFGAAVVGYAGRRTLVPVAAGALASSPPPASSRV